MNTVTILIVFHSMMCKLNLQELIFMNKMLLPVSFFFGANNKNGYCSLYNSLYSPYEEGKHLLLKGGPGTGKSTLMKKVAEKLEKKGYFVERGYCSADPGSLDIVLAPEINFSILDATAPHTFDPKMPGVSEHIVDLGVAWDRNYLKSHIYEIGELIKDNTLQHKKAVDFTGVAARIEQESAAICAGFIDEDKLLRYVKRLAARIIPERKGVPEGKVKKRFLSAVSPDGIAVQYDTVVALSEKIITVEDEFSAVSPYIAEYISAYAVNNGYDVYQCFCPLFPKYKIEHIIIPELKTAVFTENAYHYSIDDGEKTVHASRFYDKTAFKGNKEKLNLQKKAKKELIDEAVKKLSIAKDIHDRLEEYYIKATDFDTINEIGEKILRAI